MLSNKITMETVVVFCSNIKVSRLSNPVAVKQLCCYVEKAADVLCLLRIRRVCFVKFKLERTYKRLALNKFRNE